MRSSYRVEVRQTGVEASVEGKAAADSAARDRRSAVRIERGENLYRAADIIIIIIIIIIINNNAAVRKLLFSQRSSCVCPEPVLVK